MDSKVVVITGASSGIGKSLAVVFARNGFRVVISGRNEERLIAVKNQIEKSGAEVLACIVDGSKEADCKKLIDEAIHKFGRIDVLINNAGQSMRALFENTELNVIRSLMDINFWGTVYCTKFARPYLLKTKGSVVGISSIAGKKGLPGRTGYSASKFAMEGFLETLRTERQADANARAERHAARRVRARTLLEAIAAPNWRDLYRAGYVIGYGQTRDERLLAMAIAIRALSLAPDEPDVRFLVAMTVDSVTRNYAGAQLYGRQKYFQFNPETGATEVACLPQMLELPSSVGTTFHAVEGYPRCPAGVGETH